MIIVVIVFMMIIEVKTIGYHINNIIYKKMIIRHFTSSEKTLEWISALRMEIGEIWVVVVLFFHFDVLFSTRV